MYRNGKPVRTLAKQSFSSNSVFVDGSKVWFASLHSELVEFDAETFAEKTSLKHVQLMTAPPDDPSFLAASQVGFLQTRHCQKRLKEVFPRADSHCHWTAAVAFGLSAVLAGYSHFCDLQGRKLEKQSNYFLLVSLPDLQVVNQETPVALAWRRGTSSG